MRKLLGRLRGKTAAEQAELEALDARSEKGPEAARRFKEAARRVITFQKATVKPGK